LRIYWHRHIPVAEVKRRSYSHRYTSEALLNTLYQPLRIQDIAADALEQALEARVGSEQLLRRMEGLDRVQKPLLGGRLLL
jgi:hypothetical protein